MIILLPATTGGVAKALEMYSGMANISLPEFVPGALALCTTALIAGAGKVRGRARGLGGRGICYCCCLG